MPAGLKSKSRWREVPDARARNPCARSSTRAPNRRLCRQPSARQGSSAAARRIWTPRRSAIRRPCLACRGEGAQRGPGRTGDTDGGNPRGGHGMLPLDRPGRRRSLPRRELVQRYGDKLVRSSVAVTEPLEAPQGQWPPKRWSGSSMLLSRPAGTTFTAVISASSATPTRSLIRGGVVSARGRPRSGVGRRR